MSKVASPSQYFMSKQLLQKELTSKEIEEKLLDYLKQQEFKECSQCNQSTQYEKLN